MAAASAVAESHRYYPAQQVSLPDRLAIRLPTANLSLHINLGEMKITVSGTSWAIFWKSLILKNIEPYCGDLIDRRSSRDGVMLLVWQVATGKDRPVGLLGQGGSTE